MNVDVDFHPLGTRVTSQKLVPLVEWETNEEIDRYVGPRVSGVVTGVNIFLRPEGPRVAYLVTEIAMGEQHHTEAIFVQKEKGGSDEKA